MKNNFYNKIAMLDNLISKNDVHIKGWTPKRYSLFARFFPYLFAHDLMFVGKNK